MPYRILVTLHLDHSEDASLERLRDALVRRRICDWVPGGDGKPVNLPANRNTYVTTSDAETSDEAIKSTLQDVSQAFAECKVTGRIFVAVCQGWSWRTATVQAVPK